METGSINDADKGMFIAVSSVEPAMFTILHLIYDGNIGTTSFLFFVGRGRICVGSW